MANRFVNRLDEITPERLVGSASEALSESINLSRLIAFVGSGLSLVYGSLTWQDFAEKLNERAKEAVGRQSGLRFPLRLASQLDVGMSARDYVAALEYCRLAFSLLATSDDQSLFGRAVQDLFETPDEFVRSAWEHRASLLPRAGAGAGMLPEKKGDAPSTSSEMLSRAASVLYSLETLQKIGSEDLLKEFAPGLRQLLASLEEREPRFERSPGTGTPLPIDRRSVLSVFLAYARAYAPADDLATALVSISGSIHDSPTRAVASPRPLLDPIHNLHRDLGVSRYLTTNYDLELENYFMFPDDRERIRRSLTATDRRVLRMFYQEGSSWRRIHPDGSQVRSDVYDGDTTAPLFEFAIGGSDSRAHIVHLHGRADRPETIVASDSDYNRLYRAEAIARPTFDLAFDVIVAGSPILFVGTGFSEAELTRTLRQEVSNARNREDCFVMRIADERAGDMIADRMMLRTRFGAHRVDAGHRRRGEGVCVRRHRLLIDAIALKFGLLDGNAEEVDGIGFRPKTRRPSPAAVRALALAAGCTAVAAAGARGGYKPDEEDAAVIGIFLKQPFASLEPRPCAPMVAPNKTFEAEFALLATLDYDGSVVAWLTSSTSGGFAELLRGSTAHDRSLTDARKLVADYLDKLNEKLGTSAIRVELREIGRDANRHFRERSTPVTARSIQLGGSAINNRHAEIETTPSRLDAAEFGPPAWIWLDHTGAGVQRQPESITSRRRGATTLLMAERGARKGSFLRWLRSKTDATPAAPALFINCSYGQEIDSVVSMVEEFLLRCCGGDDDRRDGRSRRQRIEELHARLPCSIAPFIVLGALDRIFGIEGELLAVEFDWLLRLLFFSDRVEVVAIGSHRAERYFRHRLRDAEVDRGKAGSGRAGSRSLPESLVLELFRVRSGIGGSAPSGFTTHLASEHGRLLAAQHHRDLASGEQELARAGGASDARREMITSAARRAAVDVARAIDALKTDPQGFPSHRHTGIVAQELLNALCFIGIPVEAEVLAVAPRVKASLAQGSGGSSGSVNVQGGSDRSQADSLFRSALQLLLDRQLVTVLEPFSAATPASSRVEDIIAVRCRLAVHRAVLLHVREQFGVPISETTLSDGYNLSLYSAVPDDSPVADPALVADLAQLTDHLIHAWKDVELLSEAQCDFEELDKKYLGLDSHPADPDRLRAMHRLKRLLLLRSELCPSALRAAGGVLRGFFTSANLLGLDVFDGDGQRVRPGLISDHKRRIRRLLDMTLLLQRLYEDTADGPSGGQVTEKQPDGLPAGERSLLEDLSLSIVSLPHRRSPVGEPEQAVYRYQRFRTDCDRPTPEAIYRRHRRIGFIERHVELSGTARADAAVLPAKPFYDEEIVWLHNERGMLSYAQGDLYAATTSLRLADTANRGNLEGDELQPNACRIRLNQVPVLIERGRIAQARSLLTDLERAIKADLDDYPRFVRKGLREHNRVAGLTSAYLGLCDHLNGLFDGAERGYSAALKQLEKIREQRGIALVNFHLAQLCAGQHDRRAEATRRFDVALGAAEAGRQTDLVYQIKVSVALFKSLAREIDSDVALATFARAIEYGEHLDMYRVAAEALGARATLRSHLGDVRAAESDVARSMVLASRFGMRLRRVRLRILQGGNYVKLGDHAGARYILTRALAEADAMNYQRAAQQASALLMSVPS